MVPTSTGFELTSRGGSFLGLIKSRTFPMRDLNQGSSTAFKSPKLVPSTGRDVSSSGGSFGGLINSRTLLTIVLYQGDSISFPRRRRSKWSSEKSGMEN